MKQKLKLDLQAGVISKYPSNRQAGNRNNIQRVAGFMPSIAYLHTKDCERHANMRSVHVTKDGGFK